MPRQAEDKPLLIKVFAAVPQGLDHTRPRDSQARVLPSNCMLPVARPAWELAAWRQALRARVPMAVAPLLTRPVVLQLFFLQQRILARVCVGLPCKLAARSEVAVVLLEAKVL